MNVATSTSVITTGSNNSLGDDGKRTPHDILRDDENRSRLGWGGFDFGQYGGCRHCHFSQFANGDCLYWHQCGGCGSGRRGGGFNVQSVTYISGTTIDVVFTDTLDINSGAATTTSNYTLTTADGGDNSAISLVNLLPDNKSVRIVSTGAVIVSTGSDTITVSANIKNQFGIANGTTTAMPIFDGFQPLVVSEIKAGTAVDQYDEFVELYNRTGTAVTTSSLKLHFVNASGTSDVNVP